MLQSGTKSSKVDIQEFVTLIASEKAAQETVFYDFRILPKKAHKNHHKQFFSGEF